MGKSYNKLSLNAILLSRFTGTSAKSSAMTANNLLHTFLSYAVIIQFLPLLVSLAYLMRISKEQILSRDLKFLVYP